MPKNYVIMYGYKNNRKKAAISFHFIGTLKRHALMACYRTVIKFKEIIQRKKT